MKEFSVPCEHLFKYPVSKVKQVQQFMEITSPLWEITRHMGSHSVYLPLSSGGDFPAFTAAEAGT